MACPCGTAGWARPSPSPGLSACWRASASGAVQSRHPTTPTAGTPLTAAPAGSGRGRGAFSPPHLNGTLPVLTTPSPPAMDFNRELLSRLEAAQLGSPSALHGSGAGGASGEVTSSRRTLWPGELGPSSSSQGSSGQQTPRGGGLLEALYTSDGSPRADATARAAAAAARAATAPPGAPRVNAWSELPADIWRWVVVSLSPGDIKAARLACSDWHAALSSNVHMLRPRQLRCKSAAHRWVGGRQRLALRLR